MDKETLEEAAENKYRVENTGAMFMPNRHEVTNIYKQEAFIDGANWQQERMYSKDEVKEIIKLSCEEGMLIQRTINDKVKIPYWRIKDFTIRIFEQFKKK